MRSVTAVTDTVSTSDLNGGRPDAADLCATEPVDDDPFYGENYALWIWDDEHSIGVHTYLKTIGHVASFKHHRESIFVFLPGGVVLTSEQDGLFPSTDPTVFRGPNLVMECVEPFRRWRASYDSTAMRTTAARMRESLLCIEPAEALAFDLDITIAKPPWSHGSYLTGELANAVAAGEAPRAPWSQGMRYEQLIRVSGTIRTKDGEMPLSGAGMRTHRLGPRNTAAFPGHAWFTALWRDGRCFGLTKKCGADGVSRDHEAWVSLGDDRHAAEIVDCTLFTQKLPGEELKIELSSPLGLTTIRGEVMGTNFVSMKQPDPQRHCPGADRSHGHDRIMTQAVVRYEWDGAIGEGMAERSLRVDDMGPDPARFRT
jgi:hypothetical protein